VPLEEVSERPIERAVAFTRIHALTPPLRLSWRERLKHWTGVDRAIGFFVIARLWAALAGVVSVLMNAHFLTPSEQGYYYTFYSLVTLQVLFELGFGFVILQSVAHERARLTFGQNGVIGGDAVAHSRLASLLRLISGWYFVASVLMVVILLPVGFYFFDAHQRAGVVVTWRGPWSLLVAATALIVLLGPFVAFVEGCGFVREVSQMYLGQVVLGSLLAWTAMITHHGLYSPAMVTLSYVFMQVCLLFTPRFRHMLIRLLRRPRDENIVEWRKEIWPFQWRIAITWVSNYCMSPMMTTILFSCRGPQAAGRMGMSLSITTQLAMVGLSWMSTKASPFGNMIARGEIRELDRVFIRTLWQSTALITAGATGVFVCLVVVGHSFPKLAMRVLSPWPFVLLLLTMVMNHVLSCEALYMRAHKREPLIFQAAVVAVLCGVTTVILGRVFGVDAVTIGYFVFGGIVSLTWGTYVFRAKRREWYGISKGSRAPAA
jgi:hypothetical protein